MKENQVSNSHIRPTRIDFEEDGSTRVTFVASGSHLVYDLTFDEEVPSDALTGDPPLNRGGQAIGIAANLLRPDFNALSGTVDPEQANLRNEAGDALEVYVLGHGVRVASIERVEPSVIVVGFDVLTTSRPFTIHLGIESLNTDVDRLPSDELPADVRPDRAVFVARHVLAKYFLHWSSQLQRSDASI